MEVPDAAAGERDPLVTCIMKKRRERDKASDSEELALHELDRDPAL